MTPIEILMEEHRHIETVLSALERFAPSLHGEALSEREDLARFATYFRGFADACHHGKEEEILFRELIASGMPTEQGPLAVMNYEHEQGRALVRSLKTVSDRDGPLTSEEREEVARDAAAFIDLLRGHIQKEDQILYPMAESMLSEAVWSSIAERFEAFEQQGAPTGDHERLRALGDELVESYGA